MSSVTSISKTVRGVRLQPDPDMGFQPDTTQEVTDDHGFRPWHFFVLASLVASTAAVVLSRQSTPEHLLMISFTIAAAGAAAIGFHRMLAPLAATGEGVPGGSTAATSERARVALEREKALVLRSIKELEFDRAMGKLSATDFDEMAGRLRARAFGLMKQVDEGSAGYREEIESELRARMATRATTASLQAGATGRADLHVGSGVDSADLQVGGCASCGTGNDLDASFCKRCGAPLAGRES